MHRNRLSWLSRLVWRRFVVISGWLAWLVGGDIFRISRDVITKPSWESFVTHQRVVDGLFVFLVVYGIGWIAGSMLTVRLLADQPELGERIQGCWWAEPILLQIFTFSEHWIMATFYVLATGDVIRRGVLGWLSALHILVVLLVGPAWVKRSGQTEG